MKFNKTTTFNNLIIIKQEEKTRERERETYHGLGLGVEGPCEIGSVLFLEPDAGSERVILIVLEDASGGVVDEQDPILAAHVGEREGPSHVGPYGLGLVRLAPVHVGPARHAGRVEHVGGLRLRYVLLQRGPVLQAARPVREVDPLGPAQVAQQAPNPSGSTVN